MKTKFFTVRMITEIGLLLGIMLLMNITRVGYIPIGPINATIMHIPVIIGAILRGPKVGAILGLGFGLTSWFQAMQGASVTSFIFINPLISIVPRVIMGWLTGFMAGSFAKKTEKSVYRWAVGFWVVLLIAMSAYVVRSIVRGETYWTSLVLLGVVAIAFAVTLFYDKGKNIGSSFAAAIGTMTNTFLVMGLIYVFYAEAYMLAIGLTPDQALATVVTICVVNGLPEMILAVVISTPVCAALKKRMK